MKFTQFKAIVVHLQEQYKKEQTYLEALPADFRNYMIDNEHINLYYCTQQFLLAELCKDIPYLEEDLSWFLYEWPNLNARYLLKESQCRDLVNKVALPPHISVKNPETGVETIYTIKTLEDYLSFVQTNYQFDNE